MSTEYSMFLAKRRRLDNETLVSSDVESSDDEILDYGEENPYFRAEEIKECCYNIPWNMNTFLSYIDGPNTNDLAQEVLKDGKIQKILEELLSTVNDNSLQHFDKVKEVWGNSHFIDILLKFRVSMYKWDAYVRRSNWTLSMFIMSYIREDEMFKMIMHSDSLDFKMRAALSILIGFWSDEVSLAPLVCAMGGHALGVKIRYSEVEEEESRVASREERPEFFTVASPPSIMEVYTDKSIEKLFLQLKEVPKAVMYMEELLESLTIKGECNCSYMNPICTARVFWGDPDVGLHLIEAMKKDPHLTEALTKYAKIAQSLRCQERMTKIRDDPKYKENIGSRDPACRMRLALSILFAYWGDRDVTKLYWLLYHLQETPVIAELRGAKNTAFFYYARSTTDVENLENWLANTYGRCSEKFMTLSKEIGNIQIAICEYAEKHGYSKRGDKITIRVLLKNHTLFALLYHSRSWSYGYFPFNEDDPLKNEIFGLATSPPQFLELTPMQWG